MIEEKVLEKLEFNRIKDMLSALTLFEGGSERALAMKPTYDFEVVNQRLDETGEAMEALRFGEPSFFHGVKLIDKHIAKAKVSGLLSAAELRDVYVIWYAARMARKYIQGGNYRNLYKLCEHLTENRELENKLDRAIGEDSKLRDDATSELRTIRKQIQTSKQRIKDYLQGFVRSGQNQKMLQDAIVTERDGRYVVPVKQEYRSMVKGIVHDESASGATVYIEPLPVVDLNNRLRTLYTEERREMERILRELSSLLSVYVPELESNQQTLAIMDFIFARARLAYKMNAFRPVINRRGIIEIKRGKHPLLGEEAVPLNIEMGQDFDILVITGPNTGGKTVTLKTVGLLILMTMCGMFIPAREDSRIAIFSSIYVDIGDEQSIEQSLSTFSGHMCNIIDILSRADRQSLVLLDELGAGTDPVEGSALGRVVLEELHQRGARVLVTTHQSELKNYAYQNDRVENACVEFDPQNLMPTYELTIGMPGQSNAFEIATKLGMDKQLVQRARELVPRREMEVGNMIRQLKESHYSLDRESREVQKIKKELLEERTSLENERREFEQERREIMDKARDEASREIRKARQEVNEALKEFKELLKDKEKPPKWHEIEKKRRKIRNIKISDGPLPIRRTGGNEQILPGDYVLVTTVKQKGYVIDGPHPSGEVSVQIGSMKLNINKDSLVKIDPPVKKKEHYRSESFLDKARSISKEIDVRGQMSDDAIIEIDKYLADALLVGLESVRLIHGKGTGALRNAVRKYLKTHPSVKAYRDGLPEEGGHGVTVVDFK